MITKKILTVLGTIVALTVLSSWFHQDKASSQGLRDNNPRQERITGTWRVLADPDPNPIGDPPPFFVYATFNREGTLIQSSSDSLEGSRPGHGVWMRTGRNEFKAAFEKFIEFNLITQQQGIFVLRVEEIINLTGENSYQGLAQVSICNNAGQECQPLGTTRTESSRLSTD